MQRQHHRTKFGAEPAYEREGMKHPKAVPYVIGPEGEQLTLTNLPPRDARRWTAKRKARVVAAVEGGLISREEAREWYALSDEEYGSWKAGLERGGLKALRIRRGRKSERRQ